jgi:hypothetical protein
MHPTMIITRNFNAKYTAYDGIRADRRGTYLLDMLCKKGLVPIKINKKYTFSQNGKKSFLDIIRRTEELAKTQG